MSVSFKLVEKWRSFGHLDICGCNGSGHVVGFVTSHSLIIYV